MQEEVLSNRILIFVNGQVYFRCALADYNEEQNWRGRDLVDSSQGGWQRASLYGEIFSKEKADFEDLRLMIMDYTTRDMTFSRDVLRASQGMLRKYSILTGVHCFEGMPSPFEQSFQFQVNDEGPSKAKFGRREWPPSYSWTGWQHAVCWRENFAMTVVSDKSIGGADR